MGKTPGTSTPRSRGAYGSTRGKERQLRKRNNRAQTYRNQQAAEEVKRHQKDLDELIEQQRLNPVMEPAIGAKIQAEIEARHREAMAAIELQAEQMETEDERAEELLDEVVAEVQPLKKRLDKRKLKKDVEPKFQFAETTARMMMKAGYNVQYVIEFTGVGMDALREFPIDDEGYAIVPTDEDEDESD